MIRGGTMEGAMPSRTLCLCGLLVTAMLSPGCGTDVSCGNVREAFQEHGLYSGNVPPRPVTGDHLEICPSRHTCCTRDMEEELLVLAQREHKEGLEDNSILTTFSSQTQTFNDYFTELLENSRKHLEKIFTKAYGLIYRQNKDIFSELFDNLKDYYEGTIGNTDDVMDRFFERLFLKLFAFLNAPYNFDDDYQTCISEHMDQLNPFGSTSTKLIALIRRAFVTARTFVQGLAIGRDVIRNVMEAPATEQCTRSLMRMTYCPLCQGQGHTKPCYDYCLETMRSCLPYHADLNSAWNEYIDAMLMVAQRVDGPFNYETALSILYIRISDEIMGLQERTLRNSRKVFAVCGTPPYQNGRYNGRKKRSAMSRRRGQWRARTKLGRLVQDVKNKLEMSKDVWTQLPHSLCQDEDVIASLLNDNCRSGPDTGNMAGIEQEDVMTQISQGTNPDEADVTNQILLLQQMSSRLTAAYNGENVEWMDTEIDSGTEEVSGSGSTTTDDEDDDN